MITVQEYKALTSAGGLRIRIKDVDQKLEAYIEATKPVVNLTAALAAVRALREACVSYARARPGSGRVVGVNKVLKLATLEEQLIKLLEEGKRLGGEAGARALIKCRDTEEKVYSAISRAEELSMDWISQLITDTWYEIAGLHVGGVGRARQTTEAGAGLVLEDIAVLRRISTSPAAPGVLRAMLNQILGPRVVEQLEPMIFGSGAKHNRFPNPNGGPQMKYVLNHPVTLKGGLKIRVGGLAHELTHICVAEAFDCTAILLAIPRDFSDQEILQLSEERNVKLDELKALVAGNAELTSRRLARLKDNLIDRCKYGRGPKFTLYTEGFGRYLIEEEGQDFYDRLVGLAGRGLSASIIEYDSVVNQMLVWCHTFALSLDNPVYIKLRSLAADEMLRRARAFPKPAI
jgi:hypothetical protein